jgi:hypothetical protein
MPTPTIPDGELFFNATLYTGNGASRSITNGAPGASFQPDFIWIKSRSTADYHNLNDIVRGIVGTGSPNLFTNRTEAEATFTGFGVSALNSNGFNLIGNGSYTNASGTNYVAWQWKAGGTAVTNTSGSITSTVSANTTAGFSVVTWTGNGTAGATIGHGLGVAPQMVIAKRRSAASNWSVSATAIGATKVLFLEQTAAAATDNGPFNSTLPSSTVITLGSSTDTNASGGTFVAYCWAPIDGYSAFGSYTGNGSTDGPFVYTGFRPRFVLRKRTDAAWRWFIIDSSRDTFNVSNDGLFPNFANAEEVSTANWGVDFLSNGFKVRSTDIESNASGGNYIYMAFAENPFKYANAR